MRKLPRASAPPNPRPPLASDAAFAHGSAARLSPAELRTLSPVIAALARVVVAREVRERESRG